MKKVKQKSFITYDHSLGYLRCIAMMHVILVHIFYWLHISVGVGTSILLFEMPLFFFVSGTNNI